MSPRFSEPLTVPAAHQVLYQDETLLIVDKPAGLLAVPGRGDDKQDCLHTRLLASFADALVVHRLDMATSGLMVFARTTAAQRMLSVAFAQREMRKRYVAVVHGQPHPDPTGSLWSTIDLPLAADWPRRPLQKVDAVNGRPSITRWRAVQFDELARTTRLDLEPETGRSHQLRVHLQAIGHPIVGDALYAPDDPVAHSGRLLLHASGLGFSHPVGGRVMAFSSAAPF